MDERDAIFLYLNGLNRLVHAEAGAHVAVYPDGLREFPAIKQLFVLIVPVAMEQAGKPHFVAFTNSFLSAGKLERVCLDEAHLALTTTSYRNSLRDLYNVRARQDK